MAEDDRLAAVKRKAKKTKKAARKQRVAKKDVAEQVDEEGENPGLLLTDLVEQAESATPRIKKAAKQGKRRQKKPAPTDELEDADDEMAAMAQSDDEVAGSRLLEALGQLGSGVEQAPAASSRKRTFGTEGRPESEFHAGGVDEALTVDDLLAPLADTTGFGAVRKQLEGLSKVEPLPEPASETARSREERSLQYESSCKDAAKWIPQIQQMRRADQVILGQEEDQDTRPVSTASLVDTFKATDDFEKELEEVTMAAGATEKDLKGSAELPVNPRIRDEKERQAGAKLKSLLLREQQAAKRVKKIKSKTYRRIHRKAESREKEVLLERLEKENPELAKTLKLEYEKKHAQMRLQRQRNARKKWAATMNRFAKGDKNAQKEMTKQAQKAHDEEQALRRAIRGRDPDQSDDSEAVDLSESDSDEEAPKKRGVARQTLSKAKKLTAGELKSLEKDGDLPTTGLLGMNFMRKAIQEKRENAKKEAMGVLNELEGLDKRLDDADDSDQDVECGGDKGAGEEKVAEAASASLKRQRKFTVEELAAASAEVDALLEQDDAAVECSVSGPLTIKGMAATSVPAPAATVAATGAAEGEPKSLPSRGPKRSKAGSNSRRQPAGEEEAERNPWLNMESGSGGAISSGAVPREAGDDNEMNEGNAEASGPGDLEASRGKKRKKRKKDIEGNASLVAEAPEGTEDLLSVLNADSEVAREQRSMVRTAFVQGTQEEDFDAEVEEEERRKDEERAPKELAGWGSWTGEGVAPRKPKKAREPVATTSQPGQRVAARVQMYEGADAEPTKYFVDQMPYPFQSPDQYEQLMRQPLGREWNALPSHLQKIKPKFFSKVGAIVPPLQYVKHLPSEQRDSALKTWAAAKQPKRLKAKI